MIPLLFSFENIYRQYLFCRRNKRNTLNALRFEVQQEKNLLALKEALETRTYRSSRSVCFYAARPKLREIFAADFRDRIVHHILVDYLERIWGRFSSMTLTPAGKARESIEAFYGFSSLSVRSPGTERCLHIISTWTSKTTS